MGEFRPRQDREYVGDEIIDMFRPGLRYRARSDREFDLLRDQHLGATLRAFQAADVFVFTLGLTEAWVSAEDGAVYPACPGTIAGTFDRERHVFKNFSAKEVADDFCDFLSILRRINPQVRVILTVSPVPLVATATDQHVLLATIYSKSVLRVAAQEIVSRSTGVSYFPAYEIITGPQAPHDYFEADRRNPSREGVDMVMRVFLHACGVTQAPQLQEAPPARADQANSAAHTAPVGSAEALSRAIVDFECEEAMTDQGA